MMMHMMPTFSKLPTSKSAYQSMLGSAIDTSSPCALAAFANFVMNAVNAFVAPVQLPTLSKSMQIPSPPSLVTALTRFATSVLQLVSFWSSALFPLDPNNVAVRWIFTPWSCAFCTMELPHECLVLHPPFAELTSYEKYATCVSLSHWNWSICALVAQYGSHPYTTFPIVLALLGDTGDAFFFRPNHPFKSTSPSHPSASPRCSSHVRQFPPPHIGDSTSAHSSAVTASTARACSSSDASWPVSPRAPTAIATQKTAPAAISLSQPCIFIANLPYSSSILSIARA